MTKKAADIDMVIAETKTWRDWLSNWTVMVKARKLWIRDFLDEKQRLENPSFPQRGRYEFVAKREWTSLPDIDKAPYVTKVLEYFAEQGRYYAATYDHKPKRTKKAVKETSKKIKKKREMDLLSAAEIFIVETYYENYFMTHPDAEKTLELRLAGWSEWVSMPESGKAEYVAKLEQRRADYDEVQKYFQLFF